jgi:RNA polymerase sigma-70 factor (ECF subfamily)
MKYFCRRRRCLRQNTGSWRSEVKGVIVMTEAAVQFRAGAPGFWPGRAWLTRWDHGPDAPAARVSAEDAPASAAIGPEPEWMTRYVAAYGDRLVRFAWAYTQDHGLAQDIAQETLLRVYLYLSRHPDRAISDGWVFTVARRLLADWHRVHRRHPTLPLDVATGTPSPAEDPDRTEDLRQALARPPSRERTLVVLFYYEDWPVRHIAQEFRLSENTVRTRLFRARQKLARLLGEMPGDGDDPNA